jgi:hypothetical protein
MDDPRIRAQLRSNEARRQTHRLAGARGQAHVDFASRDNRAVAGYERGVSDNVAAGR